MKLNKIFKLSPILIGFFLLMGCVRNAQHPVPYYSFDITVNLTLPSYSGLVGVGGWAYVNAVGSRGVVVYRQSINTFVAFDRQSPSEGGLDCETPLTVDEENFLILNDNCSGDQFSLYDGSLINGNSEWGLREYATMFNGDNILRIYNP